MVLKIRFDWPVRSEPIVDLSGSLQKLKIKKNIRLTHRKRLNKLTIFFLLKKIYIYLYTFNLYLPFMPIEFD
jgi:hypothetical protein